MDLTSAWNGSGTGGKDRPTAPASPAAPASAGGSEGGDLPAGAQVWRDVPYGTGGSEAQKLHIALPAGVEGRLPVILWIHGGGWGKGSRDHWRSAPLVARGYAAVSIGYRLSHEARWPAQIVDCKAAIRFLRAHAAQFHLDPDRFGVWGESAGGHLAAFLGTSGDVRSFDLGDNLGASSRVQAVCDWFGPTDILQMDAQAPADSKIHHDSAGSPESQLIGGPIQENRDRSATVNPIPHISGATPPFLIIHGEADNLVPIGQSELLAKALHSAGVPVQFLRLPGAGHGGAKFQTPEVRGAVEGFFATRLAAVP